MPFVLNDSTGIECTQPKNSLHADSFLEDYAQHLMYDRQYLIGRTENYLVKLKNKRKLLLLLLSMFTYQNEYLNKYYL